MQSKTPKMRFRYFRNTLYYNSRSRYCRQPVKVDQSISVITPSSFTHRLTQES